MLMENFPVKSVVYAMGILLLIMRVLLLIMRGHIYIYIFLYLFVRSLTPLCFQFIHFGWVFFSTVHVRDLTPLRLIPVQIITSFTHYFCLIYPLSDKSQLEQSVITAREYERVEKAQYNGLRVWN